MATDARHGLSAKWAFEKVCIGVSLVSMRIKAKLRFFKYPYCRKPRPLGATAMTRLLLYISIIFFYLVIGIQLPQANK
jgi:hypothetical protein